MGKLSKRVNTGWIVTRVSYKYRMPSDSARSLANEAVARGCRTTRSIMANINRYMRRG